MVGQSDRKAVRLSPALSLRSRRLDGLTYGTKLLEILPEHLGQLFRLRVIRGPITPRAARVEHFCGHAGDQLRYRQAEYGIRSRCDTIETSVKRRVHHRASVAELHALADTIGAAAPSRVYKPDVRRVFIDEAAEHLR